MLNFFRQMSRHDMTFSLFVPGKCCNMSRHCITPQSAKSSSASSAAFEFKNQAAFSGTLVRRLPPKAGRGIWRFVSGGVFAAAQNPKTRRGICCFVSFWVLCRLANNSSVTKPRRRGVLCRHKTLGFYARWVLCHWHKTQNPQNGKCLVGFWGCVPRFQGFVSAKKSTQRPDSKRQKPRCRFGFLLQVVCHPLANNPPGTKLQNLVGP